MRKAAIGRVTAVGIVVALILGPPHSLVQATPGSDAVPVSLSQFRAADLLQDHPRIFFSSEDIPTLRGQFQTTHREVWQPVVDFAESMLGSSPPTSSLCPDLDPLRNEGNQMVSLAFAYVLTGDRAYFDLTRGYLLAHTQWRDWGDHNGCGGRTLGFHHMLFGNAIAYDWVYDELSERDRATIGEHLARRAQESYEASTIDYHGTEWGNWWQISYMQNHYWINHSALGIAALVLDGHDDRSEVWLSRASERIDRIRSILEGIADGTWHEGIPYQSYACSFFIPFVVNLRRLTGQDLIPHTYLRNYAAWRLYNHLPGSDRFALTYSDFEMYWHGAYDPQQFLRFIASEYQDGRAEWLAQRIIAAKGRTSAARGGRWYAFEGLYYDPTTPAQPPDGLPLDRTFRDLEGVLWRTGWGTDDLVFAIRTGPYGGRYPFTHYGPVSYLTPRYPWGHSGGYSYNIDHDHDDANSFYLYRGRTDLSSEVVGSGDRETSFHNTLLIDGKGQYFPPDCWRNYRYAEERPVPRLPDAGLEESYQAGDSSFLIADASNRYASESEGVPTDYWVEEFRRFVLFVKPNYLVMVDNVRADAAHRYEWVAHFGDSVTMEGDWVRGEAGDDQILGVRILAPTSYAVSTGDDGKPYVRIRPSSEVANVRFVNVLYPTDTANWNLTPAITSLGETDQATGVRVSLNGTQDHLIKYGVQDSVSLGEYTFDGQVASVLRDPQGNLTRVFLGNGIRLADSQGGRMLLQGSNPALVVEASYDGTALALEGENMEGLSVYGPNVDASQVTLNGQPVSTAGDGDYIVLQGSFLSLPDESAAQYITIQVPVSATDVQGVATADLTVAFDGDVISARGVSVGELTSGWSVATDVVTPGQIRVSLASRGGAVSGTGILALLEFEVVGPQGAGTALHFANASLNDGAIPTQTADGSFAVLLSGLLQVYLPTVITRQ